jgi:hypothetical protein
MSIPFTKRYGASVLNFPLFHELFYQASGTEKQSFVASLLDQDIPLDMHQDEWADTISWAAGSMYGGVQIVKTIYGTHSQPLPILEQREAKQSMQQ